MAKGTRRSRRQTLPPHNVTFHGIQEWYKHEFEKFGWMLLAKAKGYNFKITAYKRAIGHMIASIKELMSQYSDSDRIHDLKVLLMNAMVLKEHADRL
jgi:hypothetical protein